MKKNISETLSSFKENKDYFNYEDSNMCGGFITAYIVKDRSLAEKIAKNSPFIQSEFGEIDEMFYCEVPDDLKDFIHEAVSEENLSLDYPGSFYTEDFIAIEKKDSKESTIIEILDKVKNYSKKFNFA